MARQDYYYERPRQGGNGGWAIAGFLCVVILVGCALVLKRPDLIIGVAGKVNASATQPPQPTSSAARRQIDQVNEAATDAERQAIQQAAPVVAPSIPGTTPAPVGIPDVSADQARGFSPTDLGNVPVPTPTTMLSQEQFDASQASEEQNQLNTAASGQTPAQQMVQVHDAEQAAHP